MHNVGTRVNAILVLRQKVFELKDTKTSQLEINCILMNLIGKSW